MESGSKFDLKRLIMPQLVSARFLGKDDKITLSLRFTDLDGRMRERLTQALQKVERVDSPFITDVADSDIALPPGSAPLTGASFLPKEKPVDPAACMKENQDFMCDDTRVKGQQIVNIRIRSREHATRVMADLYKELPYGLGNISLLPTVQKVGEGKKEEFVPMVKIKAHEDHYDETNQLGPLSLKLLKRICGSGRSGYRDIGIFADPSQDADPDTLKMRSIRAHHSDENNALADAAHMIKSLKKEYAIDVYKPQNLFLVSVELEGVAPDGRKKKKKSSDPNDYRFIATLRGVDEEAIETALHKLGKEFHGIMHVLDRDYDKHTVRLFMEGNSNPTALVTVLHHFTGCDLPVKLGSGVVSSRHGDKLYRPRVSVELDKDEIWGYDEGVLVKSTARMLQHVLMKPCRVLDSHTEPKSRVVIDEPIDDRKEAVRQSRHARDVARTALQRRVSEENER